MNNELTTEKPASKNALSALASRLNMDPARTAEVLKGTAFKACKNDDQFAALIVVANTYGLNPLLKELYAFPGKGGEIVPIVSIDGWLRIINDHPQMDGMTEKWAEDGSWCEVTIHRKDRKHPTVHREHFEEVKRSTEPWKQHPRRMLKWKTIIQAGRVAFGFGGIHDEDEGKDADEMRDVTPKDKPDSSATRSALEALAGPRDEPSEESSEEVTKKAPEGKQTKERLVQVVDLVDISDAKTSGKKTWWTAFVKTKKGSIAEMNTFSETLHERLAGLIGERIEVTFTQTSKGGFSLEDFEAIEVQKEGGSK